MLLPFIISFCIMIFAILGVAAWVADLMNKVWNCAGNPRIWCSDLWRCHNNCPNATTPDGTVVSACFEQATAQSGLAKCLFGTESVAAQYCDPPGPPPQDINTPLCNCPANLADAPSCLAGCPSNLAQIGSGATCCCDARQTGNPNCTDCSTS